MPQVGLKLNKETLTVNSVYQSSSSIHFSQQHAAGGSLSGQVTSVHSPEMGSVQVISSLGVRIGVVYKIDKQQGPTI